jgi:hypothetical protein
MPFRPLVRLTCGAALVTCLTAATALAQPFDKRTFFTFTGPVAIPGVTLPAGEYLFRLVDATQRNVVQVLSADGQKSYAIFFAFRAERLDPAPEPEVRFLETAEGMPAAVQTWWYPGERTGYEFVYPREQARLLARGTGQRVLTTEAETITPAETRESELTRITPQGTQARVTPAEPAGPELRGRVAPPDIPIMEPAPETRAMLPKTASGVPATGLAGVALLLAAAAAGALRRVRG